jgi:hypothetical protein
VAARCLAADLPADPQGTETSGVSDALLAAHEAIFRSCIAAASHGPRPGFSAIKITALADPALLVRSLVPPFIYFLLLFFFLGGGPGENIDRSVLF